MRLLSIALLLAAAAITPASAAPSSARLTRGLLRITGDRDADDLDVTTSGGFVQVDSSSDGFLGSFPIEDVEHISIRTGAEDDSVFVSVPHFPDVTIVTSGGSDMVEVRGCIEDLRIDTGSSDDLVEVNRLYVHGSARIDTAMGDDIIVLGSNSGTGGHLANGNNNGFFTAAIFENELDIFQGIGDDELDVRRVLFGSDEERRAAAVVGIPVDMLIDFDIRISGYTGDDCYEISSSNIDLESYMISYEFDCSDL